MSVPIISVRNIRKSFRTGNSASLDVLRGVDYDVEPAAVAAVVGASGAGKSTFLHILGALDRPTSGEVTIEGRDVSSLSDAELAAFRNRRVGFVFQFHHLLPEFTAVENVAMPALIRGTSYAEADARARTLLALVGVDARAEARPAELSGGEQQRVAVARALMNAPAVVLADEPSGNLDEENAERLHDLLWSLARERGQTFVLVTHDVALARRADRVHRLHDGVLVEETAAR